MFYESITKYSRFRNKEEMRSVYLEDSINNKISNAQEMISYLEIDYLNSLGKLKEPPKLPDDPLSKMMSEVVSDIAKEGVNEDG
jgi:hypothetical protein